ncbi:peptidoglycan-binding protein [Dactylosporangium matsuzakiense]|uniref:Peptidoglycan-binding protein n=1 Tax=Dactylosporangium matsuzakiense TaxID=53360 RepID=A0A9W6KL84_9ACTN|nr:peptidoglycan-binding protein [Dactylosporangium matsuzakiense]UWZ43931.1 peptidoglycan-binding protein [Dactylosporangium matsuzakiense]GLL03228.1 peptidoglycan-binding protein [Dactylosporangium matsuzakiense]
MSDRRRRGRAGKVILGVAAVAAVGAAAAAGLGLPQTGSQAEAPKSSGPPKTATVSRQTLVDTQNEDGKLGHGDSRTLTGRGAGTLTEVPAAGTTIQRGQALYRSDNAPVVLLYGALPSYRNLAVGDEGPDVRQLEENLAALGYTGFTVDDTYSSSTASAVRKWQGDLGLTKTGTVEAARIVYAVGAVRVDERKAEPGDPSGGAILAYTSTTPVVTVDLDTSDQRLAKSGTAVTVKLPDGRSATAKISAVQTIIQPAQGNEPAKTKYRVTIVPDDVKAFDGLDQMTVTVTFTAGKRENVLAVPVQALLALAEGGYGVQVVEGGTTKVVAVELGLFAAGKVEITGAGISAGTVVGMPA